MMTYRQRAMSLFLSGAFLQFSQWAAAQDATPQGGDSYATNDIIVTAQKREERLQDVPIAITALGGAALEARGVQNIVDFETAAVPGLRISRQAGGGPVQIAIRGVSTSGQSEVTREGGTALYIDGVYMPRSQGLTGELIEPERIEVVRGPQGTLFGRNAEGGAVSITSSGPTGELGGKLKAAIGDYGQRQWIGRVNLPEIANLSLRVDAIKTDVGGFVRNKPQLPGQSLSEHHDFGEQDNWGIRAQALWRPSDTFSARYSYDYSDLFYTYESNYRIATPLGARQVDPSRVRESWIPLYNKGFDGKFHGHGLTLTWDVTDDVQIKSITSKRFAKEEGSNNLGGANSIVPVAGTDNRRSGITSYSRIVSKTFSQEFQVIGNLPRVEYVVGAFYFHERAHDARETYTSIIYEGANPPVSINPVLLAPRNQSSIESNAFAIFGQATYTPDILDDMVKITVGGRYTEDRKGAQREVRNGVTLDPPFKAQDISISRFDPTITVAYQPSRALNIYARYAQAFRSGGISNNSPAFTPFGPEVNKQVEVGFKSEPLPRTTLNVAAWHSWIKDRQTNVVVDPNNPSVIDTINAPGTSKLKGIEVEFTASPVRGFVLSGTGGYQTGKQPTYACGPCDRRFIAYFPKWTASLAADYTTEIAAEVDLLFHLDYNYTSKYNKAPTYNVGQPDLKSQDKLLNGSIRLKGLQLGPLAANVGVQVQNITDSRTFSTDTNLSWGIRQLPRRFLADIGVEF